MPRYRIEVRVGGEADHGVTEEIDADKYIVNRFGEDTFFFEFVVGEDPAKIVFTADTRNTVYIKELEGPSAN